MILNISPRLSEMKPQARLDTMDFHISFTREIVGPELFKLKGRCGKVPVSGYKGNNIADLISNPTGELISDIVRGGRVTYGADGCVRKAYAAANVMKKFSAIV